jgi:linoleoyl-CoA desaturase
VQCVSTATRSCPLTAPPGETQPCPNVVGAASGGGSSTNHLHHGNTNIVTVDSDLSQAPSARLAPGQPWRPWRRYQYLYMWFLYGFLAING